MHNGKRDDTCVEIYRSPSLCPAFVYNVSVARYRDVIELIGNGKVRPYPFDSDSSFAHSREKEGGGLRGKQSCNTVLLHTHTHTYTSRHLKTINIASFIKLPLSSINLPLDNEILPDTAKRMLA